MTERRTVYRDAISGKFVTRAFADAHPATTVAHRYKVQEESDDA